jgi:hypothetical protein
VVRPEGARASPPFQGSRRHTRTLLEVLPRTDILPVVGAATCLVFARKEPRRDW